jgi:hypothetical protein
MKRNNLPPKKSAQKCAVNALDTIQDTCYPKALKKAISYHLTHSSEPPVVIGPELARACGDANNVYAVLTGAKMFIATVGSVKAYLEAMELQEDLHLEEQP